MRTIMIAGGTGLVGKVLVKLLIQKNYKVIILTRNNSHLKNSENITYVLWNIKKGTIDIDALKKSDAIIQLSGAGVMDKKWTESYKKEIEESRTQSCKLIVDSLKGIAHKVQVIISASAIGWYGEDKIQDHFFTEIEQADSGFLGDVCKKWEQSIDAAEPLGIRVCKLRTGIVLSNDGGAYPEFKASLKFGIASILGTGRQIVSWIHIDDLCRQYIYALENENITGSYNAVAPTPVSNKELTIEIANVVKRKFYIPLHVPQFILKIMLGKRCIEILKSTTVSADKFKKEGFIFIYPKVGPAIEALEKMNV